VILANLYVRFVSRHDEVWCPTIAASPVKDPHFVARIIQFPIEFRSVVKKHVGARFETIDSIVVIWINQQGSFDTDWKTTTFTSINSGSFVERF
jgi:hypothetical protein